jgi:multicomponent Na+:H+ antiporter subunit G
MILELIGALFLLIGTVICVIGGVGLIRMPDFYTRAHAASVPDTLGAGCMIFGMICFTFAIDGGLDYRLLIIAKLLSIGVFILVTSPIAGHAVTRAAYERGIGRQFDSKTLKEGEHCQAEIIDYEVEIFEERGDVGLPELSVEDQELRDTFSDEDSTLNLDKLFDKNAPIDPDADTNEVPDISKPGGQS